MALVLGGCTLSMEEWAVPEEEKGVYEPYTAETEYTSVTYQYNEGVKPITANVLEYLYAVRDSTLYFSDNVPKEWVPQVGGYMQIGCCEPFPLGYNARVLSRTASNGLIAFTTTSATIDEIYKELVFESDGPLNIGQLPDDFDPDEFEPLDVDTMKTIVEFETEDDEEMKPDEVWGEDEDDDADGNDDTAYAPRYPLAPSGIGAWNPTFTPNPDELCTPVGDGQGPRGRVYQVRKSDEEIAAERAERASRAAARQGKPREPYIDYTLVREQVPELYQKQMQRYHPSRLTRGDVADEPDKVEKDEVSFKFNAKVALPPLKFGGREVNLPSRTVTKFTKFFDAFKKTFAEAGITIFLEGSVTKETTTTYHTYYDKKKDIQENWTMTEDKRDASVKLGTDATVAGKFKGDDGKIDAKLAKVINKMKRRSTAENNSGKRFTVGEATKFSALDFDKECVIYAPLALCLKLKTEFGMEFYFNAVGKCDAHISSWTKEGYRTEGKKKHKIHENGKPVHTAEIEMAGQILWDIYANLYVGLEIAKSAGAGMDFWVKGGVMINLDTDNSIPYTTDEYASDNSYLGPFVQVTAAVKLYFSPLGINLMEENFTIFDKDLLGSLKYYVAPSFSSKMQALNASLSDYEINPKIRSNYTFTRTGFYPWVSFFKPRLRIYEWDKATAFNPQKNMAFFDRHPLMELRPKGSDAFNTSHKYEFESNVPQLHGVSSYVVVPVLLNSLTDNYLIYPTKARQIEIGDPKLSVYKVQQTQARFMEEKEYKEYGVRHKYYYKYNIYEVGVLVDLTSGTKIREIDFDIDIYQTSNGKQLIARTLSYPKLYASGRYLFLFRFASDIEPFGAGIDTDNMMRMEVKPRFKDENDNWHEYYANTGTTIQWFMDAEDHSIKFNKSNTTKAKL